MNASLGKTEFTDSEIADLQSKVMAMKATRTWKEVGQAVAVPEGTISSWAPGRYQGDNANIAAIVHRYFLAESAKAELQADLPTIPDYVPTPSSRRFITLLRAAQMGEEMAVVSGPPGTGKSASLKQYKATNPKVILINVRKSKGSLPSMLLAILAAMGEPNVRGTPPVLSEMICRKVSGGGWLIAMDEAQRLTDSALEELQGIHDDTGVGIALFGDSNLVPKLKPFPQLSSRCGLKHLQRGALPEDIAMLLEAWGVVKGPELAFCQDIGKRPGALRGLTKALKNATFAARQDNEPLQIGHLREAWAMNDMEAGA